MALSASCYVLLFETREGSALGVLPDVKVQAPLEVHLMLRWWMEVETGVKTVETCLRSRGLRWEIRLAQALFTLAIR